MGHGPSRPLDLNVVLRARSGQSWPECQEKACNRRKNARTAPQRSWAILLPYCQVVQGHLPAPGGPGIPQERCQAPGLAQPWNPVSGTPGLITSPDLRNMHFPHGAGCHGCHGPVTHGCHDHPGSRTGQEWPPVRGRPTAHAKHCFRDSFGLLQGAKDGTGRKRALLRPYCPFLATILAILPF